MTHDGPEIECARVDHAFACGMKLALVMVAQGAEEKARERSEAMMLQALRVIRAAHPAAPAESPKGSGT